MKVLINAVLIAVFVFAAGASELIAQGPLSEILKRMDVHNKSLTSVQASVTMKKHNPQLNVTDTYLGSTSYIPRSAKESKGKLYMRLDWTKPTVEQISIIGDDYRLYKPSINQVYEGKVNKAKTSAGAGNALGFMTMSREQLRTNYDVQYISQVTLEGGTAVFHLQLTPKSQTSYKLAELWVDGNGMPLQGRVVEHNNDTTTVLLSNVRKNVKINTEIFRLNVPKGANKVAA